MKKIYLCFLFMAAIFSTAFSQSISGGLRAGLNIANQSISIGSLPQGVNATTPKLDSKVGFQIGGYLKIMTSEKFGIQPEVVFSQMGYNQNTTESISNGNLTFKLNEKNIASLGYLSLPVMLRYNITENFNLQAGPQLGILLSASGTTEISGAPVGSGITNGSKTEDIKKGYNDIDFGGAFGLGVDFGKFNAGARYYLGLSNLLKDVPSGFDIKGTNNSIQVFLGYQLFGK
jgi:Outer membrane protein beta-barrel domain